MTRPTLLSAALLVALIAAPLPGCPVCVTATGWQVSAGILDDSFAFNVFATLLPFPFLTGIAAIIHYGGGRIGKP